MKLVIGNKNYSSWSMRPWLLLKKSGVDFDEHRISLFSGDFKAQILAVSDAGKVPVLIDDDITVWDSLAICEYVSERYMDNKGWPDSSKSKALARAASAEMHAGFFAIREQMPLNCRATGRAVILTEELRKDIDRIQALWESLRSQYQSDGPWLLGQFSIADCMFIPVALRFRTYGVALNETSQAYLEQVMSDTHVLEWMKASEAESEVVAQGERG